MSSWTRFPSFFMYRSIVSITHIVYQFVINS